MDPPVAERDAGPTARPWAIVGARHAGITVSDLDRSLAFYCDLLGLELLWRRLYEEPEIRSIDALQADLLASGVRFRSDGPVEMTGGANKGGESLYSSDPDGHVIEVHEPPSHLARA